MRRGLHVRKIDDVEPMKTLEALERHLATLGELDARTGDEIVDDIGHQDLVGQGMAGHSRRVVNRRAEEAVALVERVAGVDSDPDSDPWRDVGECRAHRRLDRPSACNRSSGAREREHRPVTLRFDDAATLRRG